MELTRCHQVEEGGRVFSAETVQLEGLLFVSGQSALDDPALYFDVDLMTRLHQALELTERRVGSDVDAERTFLTKTVLDEHVDAAEV